MPLKKITPDLDENYENPMEDGSDDQDAVYLLVRFFFVLVLSLVAAAALVTWAITSFFN